MTRTSLTPCMRAVSSFMPRRRMASSTPGRPSSRFTTSMRGREFMEGSPADARLFGNPFGGAGDGVDPVLERGQRFGRLRAAVIVVHGVDAAVGPDDGRFGAGHVGPGRTAHLLVGGRDVAGQAVEA